MRTRRHGSERGSILLITLLVLIALTVLGLAVIFITGFDQEVATSARAGDQALYVADAGVQRALDMVKTNPNLVIQGYTTVSMGGTQPDGTIVDASGTQVVFPGGGTQPGKFGLQIGPEINSQGVSNVECGIIGYSDLYGRYHFVVNSVGFGPINTSRAIEAHVATPPTLGLCPPSPYMAGGYAGGA